VQDFATIQKGSKNLPLQVPYGAIPSLIRGWHSAMYNSGARGFGMLPHSRFLKSAFISPTSLYTPVFFEFITVFYPIASRGGFNMFQKFQPSVMISHFATIHSKDDDPPNHPIVS
jgi:hypothetical protein